MGDNKKLSEMIANNSNQMQRDNSLDVMNLVNNVAEKNAIQEDTYKETALERMKRQKEEAGGAGIVINKEDYVPDGQVKKEVTQVEKDIESYTTEMDEKIKTAQNLNIPKPTNAQELVETMDVLDKIAAGDSIDEETMAKLNITQKEDGQDSNINYAAPSSRTPKEQAADDELPEDMRSTDTFNRESVVQILIDKTGLGANVELTTEEHEKMVRSNKIIISEVSEERLATAEFIAPEKSFTDMVTEYSPDSIMTKVTFPASGFAGNMGGLGFGELGDIALANEKITHQKLEKKLTIIYNKLKNASIGNFENFNDFLGKFAYTDIDFAVFGLSCSTFPEQDSITLSCNHPTCKRSFEHKYSPRSLIRFDKLRNRMLKDIKTINEASSLQESKTIAKNSPVSKYKIIELPISKFLIEVGIASAREYLDDLISVLTDERWNESHPEDVNNLLQINSSFLLVIRAISVPINGKYVRFTKVEDIIQAIYNIKPDEVAILSETLTSYLRAYTAIFALENVRCPHCGTITKEIPIDINQLVFLKFQAWMNTKIELKGILDL